MRILSEILKPRRTSEIIGQDFALAKLKEFILNFKKQKKKAVIIYGPPGTGKTCSVYAIANEFNIEVLELNASDYRNSDSIESIIKPSISQKSIFFNNKIILIDELDGITGHEDRGGSQMLASLIEKSKFPIVMIANNPWETKLSILRKKSVLIEYKNLGYFAIYNTLKSISNRLDIKYTEDSLKQLAIKSNGDLRAAINDFQTLTIGKNTISLTDVELIGGRDKKNNIFNALKVIFKSKDLMAVLNVIENTDIYLDEAMLWIDENLPLEYIGDDLRMAYHYLSRADVFRGRIMRRQYYRFLVYQKNLMTAGVSLAKKDIYPNFTNYNRSTRILKYWIAKNKYQKRTEISLKIAKETHTSSYKTLQSTFPYIKLIFEKQMGASIANTLKLEADEIEYLERKTL